MTLLTTVAACRTRSGTTRWVSAASAHPCPRFLETSWRGSLHPFPFYQVSKRWSSRGRKRVRGKKKKKFCSLVLLTAVDVRAPHKHLTLPFTCRTDRKVEFQRVSRPVSRHSCLVLFRSLPFILSDLPLSSSWYVHKGDLVFLWQCFCYLFTNGIELPRGCRGWHDKWLDTGVTHDQDRRVDLWQTLSLPAAVWSALQACIMPDVSLIWPPCEQAPSLNEKLILSVCSWVELCWCC